MSASVEKARDGQVAIVLVNWNGWRDSIACIESCLALEYPNFRVIVCDNGSQDGSVERIVAWAMGVERVERDPSCPVVIAKPRLPRGVHVLDRAEAERGDDCDGAELIVVESGGNLGFAGGNNVGLRWAMAKSCAFAWLLNNDTVVPADTLAELVSQIQSCPDAGICGSTMVEYFRPDYLQGYAAAVSLKTFRARHLGAGQPVAAIDRVMRNDPARANEVVYPIGASILVSLNFLKQVGLMEESYFLYYEEADWVLRGDVAGFKVIMARNSRVFHKIGASAGSTPQGTSARSVAFLYRSRLRIAKRFSPKRYWLVVFGILEEAARAALRGRRGRVIGALRALSGRVHVPYEPKDC